MKIYSMKLVNYASAGVWTGDIPFVHYYSDVHVQYGDITGDLALKPVMGALHADIVTDSYLGAGIINRGGNNNPLTILSPEFAPYPFAGNAVICFITANDGGLSTADEELEDDYEYIRCYNDNGTDAGYLVWGTFKVTQTDFYTPKIMDTIATAKSWSPIEGLEPSSLDYSEKIAQMV